MLICPTLIVLTTATYLTQASPATSPQPPALNYTDIGLFNSTANLERYVIFLAIGWRNYTCSTPNATTAPSYALTTFDYNMFDIDDSGAAVGDLAIGKHVLPLNKDYAGGNSVFYTGVRSFTYWVGKSIKFLPGPAATSKADMMLELALRTEASEPKPAGSPDIDKYGMGLATYATRFGAKGGNAPATADGKVCTVGDKVDVWSEVWYSMWRQTA